MAAGIPARLTAAEGRKFAFTVGAAFLVLGGLTWWREKLVATSILGGLGGVLLLLGLVVPGQLGPVYRAWMGLSHLLSKVTTPIFMGVVYFLVVSPTALLMRAMGKNPLVAPAGQTYWRTRPEGKRRSNLLRQF